MADMMKGASMSRWNVKTVEAPPTPPRPPWEEKKNAAIRAGGEQRAADKAVLLRGRVALPPRAFNTRIHFFFKNGSAAVWRHSCCSCVEIDSLDGGQGIFSPPKRRKERKKERERMQMGGHLKGAANAAQRVGTVHRLSAMSLTVALPPKPVRLASLQGHIAPMTVI